MKAVQIGAVMKQSSTSVLKSVRLGRGLRRLTRTIFILLASSALFTPMLFTPVFATPVITLTGPANNTKYLPPAMITLTANASDSADTIAQVSFYNGTTFLGSATSSPYSFNWTNVATGAYSITAKATNSHGVTRASAARTLIVNTAPTVSLTSPMAGASFYGLATVNLAVNAADADGNIAKVQYFNGGALIGTSTAAPFGYTWSGVIPGNYSLTARATDNLGALVTSTAVAITVKNPVEVAITAPAANSKFLSPGNVTLTADAITRSCDTCTAPVAKVDFYALSGTGTTATTTLIGTASSAPFSFNWVNIAAGKYTIKAIATDAQQLSATAKTVSIIVNTPPTIAITSPTPATTVAGLATLNIIAAVTDPDNNITKVQFYRSGSLLGTLTSPPYSFNWQNIAPGNYSLTARATDSLGAVVTSAAIAVAVTNPITVAITNPLNKGRFQPLTSLDLSADATDSNGVITQVAYYNGSTLIGASTVAPYNVVWNNVDYGNYNLTAIATDNQGITKTSALIKITVDTSPVVNLIAPAPGATYAAPGTLNLEATAINPGAAIAKVQFYGKGKLLATVTTPPYVYQWTGVLKGSYPITARATDSLGVATTSTKINVAVVEGSVPAVGITAPTDNAIYLSAPATIDIGVAASTLSGTISKVEYFNGATLIGTVITGSSANTAGLYNLRWANVIPGTYTLTAKATSSLNLTTVSDPISVVVDAAPTLTLTSPANNAVYQTGSTIPLIVNATDSDGTIAKVDFYQGTTLLATVTSGTAGVFTTNWANVAAGIYSLTATATDNQGAAMTTPPITVLVNAAPTATWVAPMDGTTFTAPANVTLSAIASDSDGSITKVDFYNGTTLIGSIATGQTGNTGNNYSFSWTNVQGGSYPLSAIATDNNGATVNAGTISVSVNNPPTIALTSPLNNSSVNVGTPIILSATATDSDGSISQVDFYNGTTLIGSIATGQAGNTGNNYTFSWANAASGSYTLSAIATDNQNTSTTSTSVSVNVNAVPMAALTSPLNNSSVNVGTPIILSATASDSDGNISQVDFYNGITLIGTVLSGSAGDTGSGYTTTWSNIAPGTYQLTAKATDNNGARVTTAPVTVTVNATAAMIYYIHPDHLGTPRAITTSDTANTKVWEWKNEDAFGNNAPNEDPSATGTAFKYNLRFPGQYFDQETGTHYNYFRDFDPNTGRYVQSDPIGLKGGINTYAYVRGNPLVAVDPTGLVSWTGTMGSGGIIDGVGAALFVFDLTSECKCGVKMRIRGYVPTLAGGFGLKFTANSSPASFTDIWDCPKADIANGWAGAFSVTSIVGGGASWGSMRIGGLSTGLPSVTMPAYGLDISAGVFVGRGAVTSPVEITKCSDCEAK